MDYLTFYIAYLILFRLAIVIAGIICVTQGYLLFCKGIFGEGKDKGGTSVDATVGSSKFSMVNAAPGTLFALFGVALISFMVFKSSPEMTLGSHGISMKNLDSKTTDPTEAFLSMHVRADDETPGLSVWTAKGRLYEKKGDMKQAMTCYRQAVALVAEPANGLAWAYFKEGDSEKALPLSRLAVDLAPDDANARDTLSEILYSLKRFDEALEQMSHAAELDGRYAQKLSAFKEKINP